MNINHFDVTGSFISTDALGDSIGTTIGQSVSAPLVENGLSASDDDLWFEQEEDYPEVVEIEPVPGDVQEDNGYHTDATYEDEDEFERPLLEDEEIQLITTSPAIADANDENIECYDFSDSNYKHETVQLTKSVSLYQGMNKAMATDTIIDTAIDNFNRFKHEDDDDYLSRYISRQYLLKKFPVVPVKRDICINACVCFVDDEEICPVCLESRFSANGAPARSWVTLPIKPMMACLQADEASRAMMKYGVDSIKKGLNRSEGDEARVMADFFDTPAFDHFRDGNLLYSHHDLLFLLAVDGFQVFKRGSNSLQIIHLTNLSMNPLDRKKDENTIQLGFIPYCKKDQRADTFLHHIKQDFLSLERKPIVAITDAGECLAFKGHLANCNGDIPGASKCCGIPYTHTNGCRFCVQASDAVGHTRYYLPSNTEHRYRTKEEFLEGFEGAAPGRTSHSQFSALKSFSGWQFHALDSMHHLAGVAQRIWNLLRGQFTKVVQGEPVKPPLLSLAKQRRVSELMEKSKFLIPSSFSGDSKKILTPGYFRSIDWIFFGRYILGTIVIPLLESNADKKAFMAIAKLFSLVCQTTVVRGVTSKAIRGKVNAFFNWVKRGVNKISPTFFSINTHYLSHLPDLLDLLGPTHWYSLFCMERAIRVYKYCIRSTRYPDRNAGNILVELAAARRRERVVGTFGVASDAETDATDTYVVLEACEGMTFTLKGPTGTVEMGDKMPGMLRKTIQYYLNVFIDAWGHGTDIDDNTVTLFTGANAKSSIGYSIGCSTKRSNKVRVDFFVKMRIGALPGSSSSTGNRVPSVYFGEVLYFFEHKVMGEMTKLAMVKFFQAEPLGRTDLYHKIKKTANTKYGVVKLEWIHSIVGRSFGADDEQYILYKLNFHEPALPLGGLRGLPGN
jgi:hypothetical protein